MKKKKLIILLSPILIFILILNIPPSRESIISSGGSKYIIKEYLQWAFKSTKTDSIEAMFKGPIVDTTHKDFVKFIWYVPLDWGDTVYFLHKVYSNTSFFSCSGISDYHMPPNTHCEKLTYLDYNFHSSFKLLLPNKILSKDTNPSNFTLSPNQSMYTDTLDFIIKPDKLLFFLKNGYFRFYVRKENYADIQFYETIANIPNHYKGKTNMIKTRGARIYINKQLEVLIVPFSIPDDYSYYY